MPQIVFKALQLYRAMTYMGTHPMQVYEYEVAHKLTKSTFQKWWWDQCYCEARILYRECPGNFLFAWPEAF